MDQRILRFRIMALSESGIYNHWVIETLHMNRLQNIELEIEMHGEAKSFSVKPLSLEGMESIFYLLITFHSFATIILIIEFIHSTITTTTSATTTLI